MPKRKVTIDVARGMVKNLYGIRQEMKALKERDKELTAKLRSFTTDKGEDLGNEHVYDWGDCSATVRVVEREDLDHEKALDILSALSKKVQAKYLVTGTTKELFLSAYDNGDITLQQLRDATIIQTQQRLNLGINDE